MMIEIVEDFQIIYSWNKYYTHNSMKITKYKVSPADSIYFSCDTIVFLPADTYTNT